MVFDGLSRTTYGPVLDTLKEHGSMDTEVNRRQMHIASSIDASVSIGNDGIVFCTLNNFLRLFPGRIPIHRRDKSFASTSDDESDGVHRRISVATGHLASDDPLDLEVNSRVFHGDRAL